MCRHTLSWARLNSIFNGKTRSPRYGVAMGKRCFARLRPYSNPKASRKMVHNTCGNSVIAQSTLAARRCMINEQFRRICQKPGQSCSNGTSERISQPLRYHSLMMGTQPTPSNAPLRFSTFTIYANRPLTRHRFAIMQTRTDIRSSLMLTHPPRLHPCHQL